MLERAPRLMMPTVANPDILEFAERVLGPFVQLDNLTLAAFPSTSENVEGKAAGWHRDQNFMSAEYSRRLVIRSWRRAQSGAKPGRLDRNEKRR